MAEENVVEEWAGVECVMCECIHGHKAPATKHSSKKCPVCKTAKIPQVCEYEKHSCPNCVCYCNPCKRERARGAQPPGNESADSEAINTNPMEEGENELLKEEAIGSVALEEAKNQELLKEAAATTAALEEFRIKNQKLLKEAAVKATDLEKAQAQNEELLKLLDDSARRAAAFELVQSKNQKLLEEAAVEPTEFEAVKARNKELLAAAGVRVREFEDATTKNQTLLKEAGIMANDLEAVKAKNEELLDETASMTTELEMARVKQHQLQKELAIRKASLEEVTAKNEELLEEASIRTIALEEAHAMKHQLQKEEIIREAALEEVRAQNQKLLKEAAVKAAELEKARTQNEELLVETNGDQNLEITNLAAALSTSMQYVELNFEEVTPDVGNGKTGKAYFVGNLRFTEPISVIIDDANNKTIDLYTAVTNESDDDFKSAVYGQMFGANFFVGATVKAEEPFATFYFAKYQSPNAVTKVSKDMFLSNWVPDQTAFRGKLDMDERQAKAMEAVAVKYFKKSSGDKAGPVEMESRKSSRSCPRLMSPGGFGAAAGDGQFTSPGGFDDGADRHDTESDCALKLTPLKNFKVGSRKGLFVAFRPESKSPVVGILTEESERHSRVKLKTANGVIRTYDMKNIDVLPLNHRLYAEYCDDVRKFESEENERLVRQREAEIERLARQREAEIERLARKREEEQKASMQEFMTQSILQVKNEMTEVVSKLLPPLPTNKKKASPAASTSNSLHSPDDEEYPVGARKKGGGDMHEIIKETVAEALRDAIPQMYRDTKNRRRSPSRSPSPSNHSRGRTRRCSPSPSPSPPRHLPEYKHARDRSSRYSEKPDVRQSESCSPVSRYRNSEDRSARSRHVERPDARRSSSRSTESSPSPERQTHKRTSSQYSPSPSRDVKHRRR